MVISPYAILYESHVGKSSDKCIKEYQENAAICRCKFLFKEFLKFCEKDIEMFECSSCDVCARECSCENCKKVTSKFKYQYNYVLTRFISSFLKYLNTYSLFVSDQKYCVAFCTQ